MATVIHLLHKKRHGRSGGSQVQRALCAVSLLAIPLSVTRPEPLSTAAVRKRGGRRWYTPLSSPPARQPIKRSFAFKIDGKAGLPVPAFQPQSLYPSPTSQATRIPAIPSYLCYSASLSLPHAPHRQRLKTAHRAAARLGSAAKLVIKLSESG